MMTDHIASFSAEHGQSMASSLRALSDVPHPETVFSSSPLFNDVVISAATKAVFQTHDATPPCLTVPEESPSYAYHGLPTYVLEDSDNDSNTAVVRYDEESETHNHQHPPSGASHHSSKIVASPPKALHLRRSEEKEEGAYKPSGVGKEGGDAEMSSFDTFAAQSVTSTTEQSSNNPSAYATNSTNLLKSNSSSSIKSSSLSSTSSPSPAEKDKDKNNKMILAERFKTQFCRSYERGEVCPYGYNCMFAHGPAELRTVEANLDDKLCTQEAIDAFRRGQRAVEQSTRKSGAASLSTPPLPMFSAPLPPQLSGSGSKHNPLNLIMTPATNNTPHSSLTAHPTHPLYSSMNAMSLSAPITAANTQAPTAPSASAVTVQQQPQVAMSPPPSLPMQMIGGYSTYPTAFYHHPFAAPSYHHQPAASNATATASNTVPTVAYSSPYQPYPYPAHPFAFTITHAAAQQPSPYGQQYAVPTTALAHPHAFVPHPQPHLHPAAATTTTAPPPSEGALSGGAPSCAFYDSNGQRLSDETSQKVMRFLQQEAEKERTAVAQQQQQQVAQPQISSAASPLPHAAMTTVPPTYLPVPLMHHQYSPAPHSMSPYVAANSGMALHHHHAAAHQAHPPHYGYSYSMLPSTTMAPVPMQGR